MAERIILTGATGMVGEGVLLALLDEPGVEAVLSVSRRPSGHRHPKLRELLVADFFDLAAVEGELTGYSACFFCAGVSAVGRSAAEYERTTHDLTLHFARTLARLSPALAFTYVSGAGTGGRARWARVKRRTETDLLALPLRAAYMFRPGALQPVAGQRHVLTLYRWLRWLMPLFRRLGYASTLRGLARAMLRATTQGYAKPVLEVRDINELGGS